MDTIIKEGPVNDQLQTSKQYMVGKFPRDTETTGSIARQLFFIDFYNLPSDYLSSYRKRVSSMKKREVTEGLSQLSMDRVVITVLGNAKELEAELKKLGPVRVIPHTTPLTPPSMQPVVEIANSSPAIFHHDVQ